MPNHIVQGSDPEFSIADSYGACVAADNLLADGYRLGVDGRADTGEIRPSPGNPHKHLMDIRSLVKEFNQRFPNHMMLAGSRHFRQPLGGHIHMSGSGVRNAKKIVRALDVHLAIPMLMLENRISARKRRTEGEYGHLGSYRHQRELHGGFEYRTPSSWLISYQMAKMTLEIAHLIAYDYEKLFDEKGQLFIDPDDYIIRDWYVACDKEKLKEHALTAVHKLKVLPNAHQVMNSILTLENCIDLELRWRQEIDCTTRWHLPIQDLKASEMIWKMGTINPETLSIFGNPNDMACLELVRSIKEEIGSVGMEHSYYLYGILDRYGYDFAISYSFSHRDAHVEVYNITENWYGRAREKAPVEDAILIGINKRNRNESRRQETAHAIVRIVKTIERL